jgi:agmatine/peptidylarginine deiminase
MNYENFVNAVAGISQKYISMNPGMYLHMNISPDGITITHGDREKMRQEWVNMMLSEFNDNYAVDSNIILCDKNRKVLVAHFEDNGWGDDCGHGIAKCSADDEFDEKVGLAVAFAHFRGHQVPDFV